MKMFWIKGKYFLEILQWERQYVHVLASHEKKINKSALNYSLSKQGYYRGLLYMYNYFLFS